jgi:hypothetical protein
MTSSLTIITAENCALAGCFLLQLRPPFYT